ncbi:MAG: hypothetical protein HY354_03335, partial [Planctomycetes bacterium]|nr:hypothetical protein [Planctomycetota bacterium]
MRNLFNAKNVLTALVVGFTALSTIQSNIMASHGGSSSKGTEVKVKGIVSSIDCDLEVVRVLDDSVEVDLTNVKYYKILGKPGNCSQVQVGDQIEVKGYYNNGVATFVSLEDKGPSSSGEIKGIITAIAGNIITVLGSDIDTTGALVKGKLPMTVGKQVEAKVMVDSSGNL